jgi:quercetin dioxygenase-like cupin family protein
MPRVLFSSPECRIVVVDIAAGEEMGEHRVRERAVAAVVSGEVRVETADESAECLAGTLVVFEPGESHRVVASGDGDARLLLVLAPWPGSDYPSEHMPVNAVADPLPPSERPGS